jgi:imidazoleglycerol-phosphate dehydratase
MLHSFAKTSSLNIAAKASGSVHQVPAAVGRALGSAINDALGDRTGIRRYGSAAVPMDESLARVALDFSGRPYLIMRGKFSKDRIGDLHTLQIRVVIESIVNCARLTLNVSFDGENDHHKAESIFKALGLALKDAVRVEGGDIPSTKGLI